ncbi:23S rRNA (adenine(1618)-N(6))-methyltransferase RlmF [Pseudoalteromonas denitrificans]|uniref:Ribosomal RNA large subunit methyltransferase F n=1 Tax=Pseudoalteromonas denitrificans DSM 6059 TaxID=1123010 RepID=A0A1I1FFW9_9GAMM|nr:23S rRNA (adenine(1618)-N(6))-methyltransferase RlmF [Pseudoalteromonas denitrificans]SFB98171.1 23S rRNA m(6)A-1618 methyltransferase [Pseudoalteromonas denitrificans DSM 6059]
MTHSTIKPKLHPRNKHINGYDFKLLTHVLPELKSCLTITPRSQQSIDFSNSLSVKLLNKALLKACYKIDFWDIPDTYLCPAIPGRADYIHYLADLLSHDNQNTIPTGKKVRALDIGTGANLIYPILGQKEYQWHFSASDIDPISVKIAKQLVQFNNLKIDIRHQKNKSNIFTHLLTTKDSFDVTLCNPPFHASLDEATKGSKRKWQNLNKGRKQNAPDTKLNFGGQNAELWCLGGELEFIKTMIAESAEYKNQCLWFTCLVSKKENLMPLYKILKQANVAQFKTVDMAQGQKMSRFIAWSFLDKNERQVWAKESW